MLKIDFNEFVRIAYAGFLATAFLFWRYIWCQCIVLKRLPNIFSEPLTFLTCIIIVSLVLGILLYSVYRAIIYPCVRWFLYITGGLPQFRFYLTVAEELHAPNELRKMYWANACADKILTTQAPTQFREGLYRFSSFVHVPFITSFLGLLALFHDLIRQHFELWWMWLLVFAVFFIIGYKFDRFQTDPSETAFLIQHKGEYLKFIRDLSAANTEAKSVKR